MATATVDGIRSPYRYHGAWLWPVDGYYDVHDDVAGRPADWPDAELLDLAGAKRWIDERARDAALERALDRAFGVE